MQACRSPRPELVTPVKSLSTVVEPCWGGVYERGSSMDFERWKGLAPVGHLASCLSFGEELSLSTGWDDYTKRFIAANGDEGVMVAAARKLVKRLSTSEVAVLAAMLHAADYSEVANEITAPGPWVRFERTRGDHSAAVAFAIMRS